MTGDVAASVLAAARVDARYRGRPSVLAGASVVVRRDVRLAVMGANGSGKTTLLRCLSGAHEPSSGSVVSDGRPLRYKRSALVEHRQRVQLVLQDPDDQLFSADVRADVSFGPLNLGLPEREVLTRVEDALRLLALRDLAERPVHQLSYGQRKRVAIAGAVAMRPRVLLLDEPTAGLDPATVAGFYGALEDVEQSGTTVVLATHDVDLAWRWADEIAVVHDGRVTQGATEVIMSDARLLSSARLERPWQTSVLHALGIDTPVDYRPRTPEDIAAVVRSRG